MSTKQIIFYSDNEASLDICHTVIENLVMISKAKNIPVITSSIKEPLDFGVINLFHPELKRSPLSQFRQILAALEKCTADTIFFCEADVIYSMSHFDFEPDDWQAYFYNTNVYKVWLDEPIATKTDNSMQLSGLCGYRELLVGHYRRRVTKILQNQIDLIALGEEIHNEGYSKHMGYEPGGHMNPRGVDNYPMKAWESEYPNLDLRHENNLTKAKRYPKDYKDPKWAEGWVETDSIPGWGDVKNIVRMINAY